MTTGQFTQEQIDQMRAILAKHDQGSGDQLREFDLNNPPQKPYRYQEYPRCMYNHAKRLTRNANNAAEVQAALDAGWSKEPFPPAEEEDAPQFDAATAHEVARIEEIRIRNRKR